MARRKPLSQQNLELKPRVEEPKKDDLLKIELKDRRVICKSCAYDFNSSITIAYESEGDRVLIFCPSCGVCNKIKKDLTIGDKYTRKDDTTKS